MYVDNLPARGFVKVDELRCLRTFVEVARRNSFSAAAAYFGVSRATVTKQIASLEAAFNTKLINRTTKQMGLTRAGEKVLENAILLIEKYDDLHDSVRNLAGEVSGEIRIGVPPAFGTQRMLPVVQEFLQKYPDVTFVVTLLAVRKDESFVEQGLDVGIIIVPDLRDSSYVAIPLAQAPQVLVASPEYLKSAPPIEHPSDLVNHNCLLNLNKSPTGYWSFEGPDGQVSLKVKGNLKSDYGETLKDAAISGLGISMHPYYMVSEEIDNGQLRVVLPAYRPTGLDIYAIYSTRKNMPKRMRLFLEFLKDWAQRPKPWSTPSLASQP